MWWATINRKTKLEKLISHKAEIVHSPHTYMAPTFGEILHFLKLKITLLQHPQEQKEAPSGWESQS